MRILAFSDLHCDQESANRIVRESIGADVVVGAGDFGIRGERSTELFDILSHLSVPFLLVSGNHDRRHELASYCNNHENLHLLDASTQEINGITFFGIGGEIPSRSGESWNESMEENIASKHLLDAPDFQVLVTHTPPFGYCDFQKDDTHEGSESVTQAIEQRQPKLCLCGHIHHSWGRIAHLGQTTIHNLGPKPNWYSL